MVPLQNTLGTATTPPSTLRGALAVNGDLTINAAQIYPTTGSAFAITSTKADGTITFGRTGTALPAAPYSAGGNLAVAAREYRVQGGVLRVPARHADAGLDRRLDIRAGDPKRRTRCRRRDSGVGERARHPLWHPRPTRPMVFHAHERRSADRAARQAAQPQRCRHRHPERRNGRSQRRRRHLCL
ncbi:MAG: hypothetical protein WDN03_16265 [Rhizomicrobium sp.]